MRGVTELVFERRGERTVLARSRSELPLQVQRPIDGPCGEAIVTLLTPAGALFDGDEVALHVECGAGADVLLRQTGATRLNRCDVGTIRVEAEFTVAANARLRYLPFELIPHAGADYHQSLHLQLEPGAGATVLEIVSPGRLMERFSYRKLALRLDVHLDDALILLDAIDLDPSEADCARALGGYSHFGSLILLGPTVGQREADILHQALQIPGVRGSASLLPAYGVGARFVGTSADTLTRSIRTALALCPPAGVWGLGDRGWEPRAPLRHDPRSGRIVLEA